MSLNDLDIPPNATVRQEYVKCGNPDCQNSHYPYLYAYWKQDKKFIRDLASNNEYPKKYGWWISELNSLGVEIFGNVPLILTDN